MVLFSCSKKTNWEKNSIDMHRVFSWFITKHCSTVGGKKCYSKKQWPLLKGGRMNKMKGKKQYCLSDFTVVTL